VSSTRISCHINTPRASVYRALLDARAIAKWKVPDGMTCHVHNFDAREGGSFRVSLTYDTPTGTGKTTGHIDTYHGRFVKPVPDEKVVEVDEFEKNDPERSANYSCRDQLGAEQLRLLFPTLSATRPLGTNYDGRWERLSDCRRLELVLCSA
jgi:uncharacterized protein YndB with AHSA1/START domain